MNSILQLLAGTWFVVSTNFPMWLKGTKTDPQFHYAISERRGITGLDDKVTYIKKGKIKTIHGFDKPEDGKKFTWRGYGLLAIAKSKWEIRLMDENDEWAVIYFSKTLFTPEGVDIISRKKDISPETIAKIKKLMESDEVLKEHVGSLKDL